MSRADRLHARTRWRDKRKMMRRAIRHSQQKLPPQLRRDINITAMLRASWRRFMRIFYLRPWGRKRNANERATARPRVRISSGQRPQSYLTRGAWR